MVKIFTKKMWGPIYLATLKIRGTLETPQQWDTTLFWRRKETEQTRNCNQFIRI